MTYPRNYTPRPTRPATPGQLEWIEKKLSEYSATHNRQVMADLTGHSFDDLTSKTAGTWLDILFGLPPVAVPGAVTEPGVYVHDGIRYQVVRTQDQTRLYAKVWDEATSKFVYDRDGVKVRDLRADELTADVPAPKRRQRRAPAAKVAAVAGGHQSLSRSIDETPMQYNGRVFGPPPGFAGAELVGDEATHDDADLLAHFGIH